MAEERPQRRLAAIMAADVVGYSRLMEQDEAGTLARVTSLLAAIIDPRIAQDGGRIVKTMGDGVLVEFPSAVAAVENALSIQEAIAQHEANEPDEKRIQFRIGINVGDVIIEEEDVYGEGVNVAARLERLCAPAEVYVSGTVFDQASGKVVAKFDDLGEQNLKNIVKPVRTYRVRTEADGTDTFQKSVPANAPAPLFDKPSIAVLPFTNLSGDPEQEYFADGMAEDIITALSRFRWFFVMARNSSFIYKGHNVDVRQVGRELGVRYVLEGSVRKGGNRLRISAQLVEASTGNHLWAEKYDGKLEDVFELQDRITEGVAGAIEPTLRLAEIERARRKRPGSLDAYDLYLRALPAAWDYTLRDTERAVELLEEALRIDPGYVAAHGLAAWGHAHYAGFADHSDRSKSVQHARAVLRPDTDDSLALAFAAWSIAAFECEYDVALDAVNRALALTPNTSIVLSLAALVNSYAAHFDTAIELADASLRLSPHDPMRFVADLARAFSYFFIGRYEDASEAAQRSANINPEFVPALAILVASRALDGKLHEARVAANRLLDQSPDFTVSKYLTIRRFSPELLEQLAGALRKAGLAE